MGVCSCHGVAGPFDRYCGFCGHELVRGEERAPYWRLWMLAGLIPLVAGLVYGVVWAASHPVK